MQKYYKGGEFMHEYEWMNGAGISSLYYEKDFEKDKKDIILEIKDILKEKTELSIELEKEDGTSEYIVELGVLVEKYKYLLEE